MSISESNLHSWDLVATDQPCNLALHFRARADYLVAVTLSSDAIFDRSGIPYLAWIHRVTGSAMVIAPTCGHRDKTLTIIWFKSCDDPWLQTNTKPRGGGDEWSIAQHEHSCSSSESKQEDVLMIEYILGYIVSITLLYILRQRDREPRITHIYEDLDTAIRQEYILCRQRSGWLYICTMRRSDG